MDSLIDEYTTFSMSTHPYTPSFHSGSASRWSLSTVSSTTSDDSSYSVPFSSTSAICELHETKACRICFGDEDQITPPRSSSSRSESPCSMYEDERDHYTQENNFNLLRSPTPSPRHRADSVVSVNTKKSSHTEYTKTTFPIEQSTSRDRSHSFSRPFRQANTRRMTHFVTSREGLRAVDAQFDISVHDDPIINSLSPMSASPRDDSSHSSIFAVGQKPRPQQWGNTTFYRARAGVMGVLARANTDANSQAARLQFAGVPDGTKLPVGKKTQLPGPARKTIPSDLSPEDSCQVSCADVDEHEIPDSPNLIFKCTKAFGVPENPVAHPNLKLVDKSGEVWAVFTGDVTESTYPPARIGTVSILKSGLDDVFLEKIVVSFMVLIKTMWRWEAFGSM